MGRRNRSPGTLWIVGSGDPTRGLVRAHLSGVPVSIADILGMTFRRCDPRVVVRTLIMAKQVGIELPCGEVERAYLHGADLQKITSALIRAKEENVDITFQQLVDADVDERRDGRGRSRV